MGDKWTKEQCRSIELSMGLFFGVLSILAVVL